MYTCILIIRYKVSPIICGQCAASLEISKRRVMSSGSRLHLFAGGRAGEWRTPIAMNGAAAAPVMCECKMFARENGDAQFATLLVLHL